MTVKKPTVVLAYPFDARIISEELKPHAHVVIAQTPQALSRAMRNADALISIVSTPVNRSLLEKSPGLRVVGNFAVGLDNIDQKECQSRKIRVCNTPDVLTRTTAELTLALLLAVARRIPEGEALCRSGRFKGWAPDMLLGLELKGRRAVIVGQGRIGKETAKLFRGIGLKVEFIRRSDSREMIRAKLERAQILSLHVPYKAETRQWLNQERLGLLPRDAIVLNTTRGPVIDEKALIRVLRAKRIFGAGLDVFEKEPAIPLSLRKLSNVVLLPHLGSATRETREAMARLVMTGVVKILSGKHPWNEVRFHR